MEENPKGHNKVLSGGERKSKLKQIVQTSFAGPDNPVLINRIILKQCEDHS